VVPTVKQGGGGKPPPRIARHDNNWGQLATQRHPRCEVGGPFEGGGGLYLPTAIFMPLGILASVTEAQFTVANVTKQKM